MDDSFSRLSRPQTAGTPLDYHQKPNTTAKYYVRSELRQFNKYLTGFSWNFAIQFESSTIVFLYF